MGCVMFEISALYPLFPGDNEVDQVNKIHTILGTPIDPVSTTSRILWPYMSPLHTHLTTTHTHRQVRKYFERRASAHINLQFKAQKGTGIKTMVPHLSKEAVDLLERMLTYDPRQRISAKDVSTTPPAPTPYAHHTPQALTRAPSPLQALLHPYFEDLRRVPTPPLLDTPGLRFEDMVGSKKKGSSAPGASVSSSRRASMDAASTRKQASKSKAAEGGAKAKAGGGTNQAPAKAVEKDTNKPSVAVPASPADTSTHVGTSSVSASSPSAHSGASPSPLVAAASGSTSSKPVASAAAATAAAAATTTETSVPQGSLPQVQGASAVKTSPIQPAPAVIAAASTTAGAGAGGGAARQATHGSTGGSIGYKASPAGTLKAARKDAAAALSKPHHSEEQAPLDVSSPRSLSGSFSHIALQPPHGKNHRSPREQAPQQQQQQQQHTSKDPHGQSKHRRRKHSNSTAHDKAREASLRYDEQFSNTRASQGSHASSTRRSDAGGRRSHRDEGSKTRTRKSKGHRDGGGLPKLDASGTSELPPILGDTGGGGAGGGGGGGGGARHNRDLYDSGGNYIAAGSVRQKGLPHVSTHAHTHGHGHHHHQRSPHRSPHHGGHGSHHHSSHHHGSTHGHYRKYGDHRRRKRSDSSVLKSSSDLTSVPASISTGRLHKNSRYSFPAANRTGGTGRTGGYAQNKYGSPARLYGGGGGGGGGGGRKSGVSRTSASGMASSLQALHNSNVGLGGRHGGAGSGLRSGAPLSVSHVASNASVSSSTRRASGGRRNVTSTYAAYFSRSSNRAAVGGGAGAGGSSTKRSTGGGGYYGGGGGGGGARRYRSNVGGTGLAKIGGGGRSYQ